MWTPVCFLYQTVDVSLGVVVASLWWALHLRKAEMRVHHHLDEVHQRQEEHWLKGLEYLTRVNQGRPPQGWDLVDAFAPARAAQRDRYLEDEEWKKRNN